MATTKCDSRHMRKAEPWESWLRDLSKFHDYRLGNTILIAMQMPTATHVNSFRYWKRDFNCYVRKDERGIEVLVPMLVKCCNEERQDSVRRLVGFHADHVFYASLADGESPLTLVGSFPRKHLQKELGAPQRAYNQVANYVFLEHRIIWLLVCCAGQYFTTTLDVCHILDTYFGGNSDEQQLMVTLATNCIHMNIFVMEATDYQRFLEERRTLMARR